jgi:IS5 family transposase
MRARRTHQMNLFSVTVRHEIGKELETISEILDQNQDVLDCILVALTNSRRKDTGRKGLNAEQVLRICALKQFRALSYEELAFHLEDSQVFRAFARLDMGQYPSSSITFH